MSVYITQNGNSLSQWLLNTNYVASFQGDYDDLYTTIGGGQTNPLSKPTTVFTALSDLNSRKFNLTGGTVSGPTTFTAIVTHTANIVATSIAMSGNLDIATTKFTVNATTGNVHTDGVLDVDGTGNNTFAGSVDITGQLAINVNKFVVTPATGDVLVAGDLTVNGADIRSTATNFNLFPENVVALALGNTNTVVTSSGNFVVASGKTLTASGGGSLTGTWSDMGSVTTIDINGGEIDGTTIGDSTRSTAKFTTLAANDSVTFTKNASSTNTTTGTLVVTGGTGISENLNVGGNAAVTGTLTVTDNVTLNKNVTVVGSDTAATEYFKIKNGSSVDKFVVDSSSGNTDIQGTLDVKSDVRVNTNKFVVTASSGNTAVAGTLTVTDDVTLNKNVTVVGSETTATEYFKITNGATVPVIYFSVDSVNGNTFAGGTLNVTGNTYINSNKFIILAATGNFSSAGTGDVAGDFKVNTNKFTVTATSGDVLVAGDIAVNGGDVTSSSTTFNFVEATVTTLNIGAAADVNIGGAAKTIKTRGNFVVDTNKTFSQIGTGTFSTGTGSVSLNGNTSVTGSNTFTVGTGASTLGGTLTVTGLTTLNGGITADGGVFSVADTTGDVATGSTVTLQNVAGIITLRGNTGSTTANIFNGVSTIVNAFGTATSIIMGALTGTTNIRNNLDVDLDLNVDGGDITTSSATFNLLNSTATTVNAFGAASTINIAASAVTTLTIGQNASGNIVRINGTASGTSGLLSSVTSGTQNLFTGITTGTLNVATGGAATVNIGATGSVVNMLGSATVASTLDVTSDVRINTNKFVIVASSGDVTTSGDIAVNGGDITTSSATFNLLNSNATAVNAFGAATAITIGATTGTTNIRHNLDVDLDVNIDGGDITTSAATFNIVNSTATTVNLGGAADVNIGGSAKTVTIANNFQVNGNSFLGNASSDTVTINAGIAYVPNTLNIVEDDTVNTAVSYPVRITHTSSATTGFAAGMGVGIDWAAETGNGIVKIGGTTEFVTTDVTSNSEDFDFVIKSMINGAAAAQIVRANQGYFQIGSLGGTTSLTTQGTSTLVINTNNGTNSGNITINQGSNAHISITPNGTGDVQLVADTVQIGDNNTTAYITTNGTGDLVLNTNSGTNSGSITIANGLSGNITIEPSNTGDVYLKSDTVYCGDANAAVVLTSNGNGSMTLTSNGTADTIINTNGGINSGNITVKNGVNGNIEIEPNGTGDVLLKADTVVHGDSGSTAYLTTSGTGDMVLNTNGGTNSGSVTIKQGANGNIDVTPNGDGLVTMFGIAAIGVKSTTNPTAGTTNIAPAIPKGTYKVVELTISAVDGVNTKISKILVAHNGTTIDFTEYNMMAVGTLAPTYSISLGATNIEVTTNITSATTVYKVIATAL